MKHAQHPAPVIIREFKIKDYDDVLFLWDNAKLPYRPKGRDSRTRIEGELKRGNAIFLVAEADGRLIGTVLGTHDGRKGWINRLAVDETFRKQNIARRLVAEAENRLLKLGIDVIACLIEEENTDSMQVFERLGYDRGPVTYFSKRPSSEA